MAERNVKIESTPTGLVVHVGHNITLPGVYTSEFYAERALDKYLTKQKLGTLAMKAARKAKRMKNAENTTS